MRIFLGLALVLAACGGPAKKITTPPIVEVVPPPPPPFDVATSPTINALATDATHLYWSDDQGIYRRPLGPDQKSERLFAATYVSLLAPGSKELFFVDEEARVRAVALTGGQAREVDAPEDTPWALYAERDAVWYALSEQLVGITPSGRRTIDVVGVSTGPFAAANGAAFVVRYSDDDSLYHLERIDLAKATTTEISHADFLSEATAMALIGDELVVLLGDGAVAIPLDGGKPHRAFFGSASGVAADTEGYAVGGYGFVVTHARNQPPHLVATGTMQDSVTATSSMAVAGEYVYYTASSNETGDTILRAAARAGGAVLMRLPVDAAVTALAAAPGAVYAGIEDGNGTGLFQVGTKKVKPLTPTGWVEQLVAGDPGLVAIVDGSMMGVSEHGEMSVITEAPYTQVVIHKGKAYWGEGSVIRAASLPSGAPFDVVDVSKFDETWMDQQIGAVAFANDHLYFVINVGERQGIAQLDEERQLSWLWTWTQGPDDYLSIDPNVVAVGDRLYVHDGVFVYQVGLDGAATRIYDGEAKNEEDSTVNIAQLFPAGDRLFAKVYTDGEELIELPTDGGKPRPVWSSSLDSSYLSFVAVSPEAIYVHVGELMSIVKIPLD